MDHRRALRDMALATVRYVSALAAGIATVPFVAHALGPDGLGAWALLGAATFMLGAADLGMSVVVQRETVAGDRARALRSVELTLWVLCVSAPLLGGMVLLAIADLQAVPASMRHDYQLALRFAVGFGVLAAFGYPYKALLLARGRMQDLAAARLAASVTQVALIALGFALSRSLVVPVVSIGLALALETLVCVLRARALEPELALWPRRVPRLTELREALGNGSAALAINLGAMLAMRADVFMLASAAPLAVVGGYGVARRAVDQGFTLAKQTSSALLPRLGHPAARAAAVQLGTAVLAVLVASGMPALVTGGHGLLIAWAGPVAALPETSVAIGLLAIAAVVSSTHEVAASCLTMGGRSAWAAAGPIVAGYALNVAITVLGVHAFGVWAVAGGSVAGALLTTALIWRSALAELGWRARHALRVLAPALVALGVTILAGLVIGRLGDHGLTQSLLICTAIVTLGLLAAALAHRRFA